MSELRLMHDELLDDARVPIDVARLEKGDAVAVLAIECAHGVVRGTDAYRLAMLKLREAVSHDFARRDPPQTVTLREDAELGLVVLTDDEAVEANNRSKRIGMRKVRRAHKRHQGIDRGKVAQSNQPVLDRALELGGRILSAVAREIRRPLPANKPRERQTPGRSSRK